MTGHIFEELREKAAKNKIPLVTHFDLTYKCNLRCSHCYIVSRNNSELSTSKTKNILRQLANAGALYLTLSGGEILTRKDFFDIAFYARKLHFALRLLTNGTLIKSKTADKISSLNPELVGISIYSMKPEIHDEITGIRGSFKKSISAIKMLKKRDTRVKISTVIMEQNIKDYNSIYEFADNIGAKFQADYRISPRSDGGKYPLNFHIRDKDLTRVLSDPIFLNKNESEPQEAYSGIFNEVPCGAGHMSCYVSPYGYVYPCVQLPINCGDLNQNSFKDIWERSPQMLNFRSITINELPVCSKCNLFRCCRLCVGLNYVEERSIFSPSKRTCKEAEIMKKLGVLRR